MSETEQVTTSEKLKQWWAQVSPWAEPNDLAKAVDKFDSVGPMDIYYRGTPKYTIHLFILFMAGIYLICVLFINLRIEEGVVYVTKQWHEYLNIIAQADILGAGLMVIYIVVDMQRGTFSHFEKQLDPLLIQPLHDMKTIIPSVLRIKKIEHVWPRELKKSAIERERDMLAEEIQQEEETKKKEEEADKKDDETQAVAAAITEEDRKEKAAEAGQLAYSSMWEVKKRVEEYLQAIDQGEFDPKRIALELRDRWLKICEAIELEYCVAVLHCVNPEYVIVISRRRFEDEVEDYSIKQRTFVWSDTNKHGAPCWFIDILEHKFYARIDRRLEFLGLKRRSLKLAKVVWVAASGAMVKEQADKIKQSYAEDAPNKTNIDMTKLALEATLTEEVLAVNTLLVSDNQKKTNELKRADEMAEAKAKDVVIKLAKDLAMSGKITDKRLTSRFYNIVPKSAIKILAIIILGLFVLIGFLAILQAISGVPILFPPSGNYTGGGGIYVGGGA